MEFPVVVSAMVEDLGRVTSLTHVVGLGHGVL
jgi:hypothetical protein